MKASEFKEKYKKENPQEFKKLRWNIPYQFSRLWFRIKMFFYS